MQKEEFLRMMHRLPQDKFGDRYFNMLFDPKLLDYEGATDQHHVDTEHEDGEYTEEGDWEEFGGGMYAFKEAPEFVLDWVWDSEEEKGYWVLKNNETWCLIPKMVPEKLIELLVPHYVGKYK